MTQERQAASFGERASGAVPRAGDIDALRDHVARLDDVLRAARRAVTVLEAELEELRLELDGAERATSPVEPLPPAPVTSIVIPPPPSGRVGPSWEEALRDALDESAPGVPTGTPVDAPPVGQAQEPGPVAPDAPEPLGTPLRPRSGPPSGVAATGAARLAGGRRIVRFRLDAEATDEGDPAPSP